MNLYPLFSGLYYAGMMLIFAGAVMQLTNTPNAFWVFSAGVLPVLGTRIYNLVVGPSQNRRKNLILTASALFLTTAAAAILFQRSYWVLFIAVAAILDGYISFRRFN